MKTWRSYFQQYQIDKMLIHEGSAGFFMLLDILQDIYPMEQYVIGQLLHLVKD